MGRPRPLTLWAPTGEFAHAAPERGTSRRKRRSACLGSLHPIPEASMLVRMPGCRDADERVSWNYPLLPRLSA